MDSGRGFYSSGSAISARLGNKRNNKPLSIKFIMQNPAACVFLITSLIWVPAAINDIAKVNRGAAENVSSVLLKQPFIESEDLVYKWIGDVMKDCQTEFEQVIVDSENVITKITGQSPSYMIDSHVKNRSIEISVKVPHIVASGPAEYIATEKSYCSMLNFITGPKVTQWRIFFNVHK